MLCSGYITQVAIPHLLKLLEHVEDGRLSLLIFNPHLDLILPIFLRFFRSDTIRFGIRCHLLPLLKAGRILQRLNAIYLRRRG